MPELGKARATGLEILGGSNYRLEPEEKWIEAAELSFDHGRRRVVNAVSFALRPGRHYLLAGPNGAGKSTLMDLLAGLKKPAGGELRLFGKSLGAYPPGGLAKILALAQQEFTLHFPFTVREVVAMGRRPYLGRWGRLEAEDVAAVAAALGNLRLEELAERPVTALSGGERRRVVVARTLAQATPIVLLDEPGAGLDVGRALELLALARSLAESGKLVVTVSHDLSLAARFAHEIIFLRDGKVLAAGPVAEVLTDEVIGEAYGTEARVWQDEFTGGVAVAFR